MLPLARPSAPPADDLPERFLAGTFARGREPRRVMQSEARKWREAIQDAHVRAE